MITENTSITSPAEKRYIQAERKLAVLLGWSKFATAAEALLGLPPDNIPKCRGQALVPRWCREWSAAGPLITQYDIDLQHDGKDSVSVHWEGAAQGQTHDIIDHPTKDAATRFAIVQAVIKKLEAQPSPQRSAPKSAGLAPK